MLDKLNAQEREDLKQARLLYYDFFYGFFVFEMLDGREKLAQDQIRILLQAPLNDEAEASLQILQSELQTNGIKNIKAEFSKMFALPFGEKQVGMHLSHYYENCIGAESLLKMRSLVKLSDVRVETLYFKETEEHLGFICGFLRYLIQNNNETLAKDVFLFSKDAFYGLVKEIKERKDAKFYLALAMLLESFLDFEKEIYV